MPKDLTANPTRVCALSTFQVPVGMPIRLRVLVVMFDRLSLRFLLGVRAAGCRFTLKTNGSGRFGQRVGENHVNSRRVALGADPGGLEDNGWLASCPGDVAVIGAESASLPRLRREALPIVRRWRLLGEEWTPAGPQRGDQERRCAAGRVPLCRRFRGVTDRSAKRISAGPPSQLSKPP